MTTIVLVSLIGILSSITLAGIATTYLIMKSSWTLDYDKDGNLIDLVQIDKSSRKIVFFIAVFSIASIVFLIVFIIACNSPIANF